MTRDLTLPTLQALISRRFPEHRQGRYSLLTAGWDCVAVDVDGAVIFKFPRHEAAEQALAGEARLLALVRPAVTMAVPDAALHAGPPMFSRHAKIKGEHLLTPHYQRLPPKARARLAADMAGFYAELHRVPHDEAMAAGAAPITPWSQPDEILRRIWPVLPEALHAYAAKVIGRWQDLPPEPHGTVFGFFDGHGWNMAFDHARGRLNGVYDFGDAGFGPLHREFIYSNWISEDLTERIVSEYELLTGRALDRERIALLSAVLRLWELAEVAEDPGQVPQMVATVVAWAGPWRA
jgi:hypothetical protein